MNKFRKIFFSLIIAFVCVVGLTTSVRAEEIDFDNVKLMIEGLTDNSQIGAYIIVKNGDNYGLSGTEGSGGYKVLITKDDSNIPQKITQESLLESLVAHTPVSGGSSYYDTKILNTAYVKYAEQYGDIYVTFYKSNTYFADESQTTKITDWNKVSEPILVKRPEELPLRKRFKVYLFHDTTSIFYFGVNEVDVEKNVLYKIGRVTDNSLLLNIKTGETTAFEQLLSYAKNDSNIVSSGKTLIEDNQSKSLYKSENLIEGNYYYAYLELDTEGGKFYPAEDIELYQCRKDSTTGKLMLFNVDDSKFEWNIQETEWDKFVKHFKEAKILGNYDKDTYDFKMDSTENSLSVELTYDNKKYTTNFKYENGVLLYEPKKDSTDLERFVDSLWTLNSIYAISDLKGYNYDEVNSWVNKEKNNGLTLNQDGIEFATREYKYEKNDETGFLSINSSIFDSYKLDIKNGLKKFNEVNIEKPEEDFVIYDFISGENQKYKINETKELKFEIDAEYDLFESVLVNGKLIDSSSYTVSEGSTIVVLKQKYLDTLNNGVHTLRVNFKDGGYAETKFTVEKTVENPSTGIGITGGILVLGFILMGIYFIMKRHTKFPKHN